MYKSIEFNLMNKEKPQILILEMPQSGNFSLIELSVALEMF